MNNNNLNELSIVLQVIRQKVHPEVPEELIENILQVEYEYQDDRTTASKRVAKIFEEHFRKNQL
jgi:hypothetical protein